jgi:hypothetical protein
MTLAGVVTRRIENQLRRLGGSYDWSRVAFTMNPVPVASLICYGHDRTNAPADFLYSRQRDFLPLSGRWHHLPRQPHGQLVCTLKNHNIESGSEPQRFHA